MSVQKLLYLLKFFFYGVFNVISKNFFPETFNFFSISIMEHFYILFMFLFDISIVFAKEIKDEAVFNNHFIVCLDLRHIHD